MSTTDQPHANHSKIIILTTIFFYGDWGLWMANYTLLGTVKESSSPAFLLAHATLYLII